MEIVAGGFVLAVLSAGEGVDFASYSRRYYSGEAVDADGLQFIHPESRRDGTLDVPPAPPSIIDLESAPEDRLSAEQREYLTRRLPLALRTFSHRCPILPNEVLVEASMGALLEPWCGLAPGTMIYIRKTNLGTVASAIAGMTVDLKTGVTSYPQLTQRTLFTPSPHVNIEYAEMAVEASLTITQFVGFAFPPYGLILAGGAAVIQLIFGKLMSRGKKVDLPKTIRDAVEQAILNRDLQVDHAKIVTVYDWFTTYYNAAYVGDGIKKTDEQFGEFKTDLNNLIAPSDFRTIPNQMMEPMYMKKGFPLFLLSTSLLLLLLKVKLLIDSSNKAVVDTVAYLDLTDTLTRSINHAHQQALENKKMIDLLNKITGVERLPKECHISNNSSYCDPARYEWRDENDNQHKYWDTWQDCAHTRYTEHRAEADRDHDEHYSTLKRSLYSQYGDPDKIAQTIAAWEKAASDYAAYKP